MKENKDSINLVKSVAIILIVVSHVVLTLRTIPVLGTADFVYDISNASSRIQPIILAWLSSFGQQGNMLFFVCSAWFLMDRMGIKNEKIFRMLGDVWFISVVILACFLIFGGGHWLQIYHKMHIT